MKYICSWSNAEAETDWKLPQKPNRWEPRLKLIIKGQKLNSLGLYLLISFAFSIPMSVLCTSIAVTWWLNYLITVVEMAWTFAEIQENPLVIDEAKGYSARLQAYTVYREIFAVKKCSRLSVTVKISRTKFFLQQNTVTVFLIQEVHCRPQYHHRRLLQQIEKWKKPSVPHLVVNLGHTGSIVLSVWAEIDKYACHHSVTAPRFHDKLRAVKAGPLVLC